MKRHGRQPTKKQTASHLVPLTPTERLIQVLERKKDSALLPIIERARQGLYDETRSTLDLPLAQLVCDLNSAGYPDLAYRAFHGEWEATGEEIASAAVYPIPGGSHAPQAPRPHNL